MKKVNNVLTHLQIRFWKNSSVLTQNLHARNFDQDKNSFRKQILVPLFFKHGNGSV